MHMTKINQKSKQNDEQCTKLRGQDGKRIYRCNDIKILIHKIEMCHLFPLIVFVDIILVQSCAGGIQSCPEIKVKIRESEVVGMNI